MPQVWDGISETRLIETGKGNSASQDNLKMKKMKIQKSISIVIASIIMLLLCFTTINSFAQIKTRSAMMKDCCMMKDGKIMVMKDGKTMPMEKNLTMKNGTVVMTTGEYSMTDGEKMMMKEGDCLEMSGKNV